MEFMIDLGEKTRAIGERIGLNMRWEQYSPLISWFPCAPHRVADPQYDLYCFSYRDIIHTASASMEQPWLDEVSKMSPFTYNVSIAAATAQTKGLRDGDLIEIESSYGHRVRGTVKVRRGSTRRPSLSRQRRATGRRASL